MPLFLFSSEGLAALAGYVTPETLFAFDLDGTLTPIVEEYSATQVDEPLRATLQRLIRLAKVAVITGRSRKKALHILGLEPHLLIGNHGAEWPTDTDETFVQCCTIWHKQLQNELGDVQGLELEFKGASLSLHYRKAINQESVLEQIDAAVNKLQPCPRRIAGKFVVNLLPMEALTKGKALVAAMDKLGLSQTIFFGDDVTDEDVFLLKNIDLLGIHIGKDDQTSAAFYLNRQSEMLGLLNSMVSILELNNPENGG